MDEAPVTHDQAARLRREAWLSAAGIKCGTTPLTTVLRIGGVPNPDYLRAAAAAVARRHATLRARFDGSDHQTFVGPRDGPTFPVHVATEAVGADADRVYEVAAGRLDRTSGPVAALTVVPCTDKSTWLALTCEQLIADARAIQVIVNDLSATYTSIRSGRAPSWPTPSLDYGAIFRRRNAWVNGPRGRASLDFWRSRFADSPYPRVELPGYHGLNDLRTAAVTDRVHLRIPGSLLQRARHSLGLRLGNPFAVLAAAHLVLIYARTQRRHVGLLSPFTRRPGSTLHDAVMHLASPVRIDAHIEPEDEFQSIVRAVQRQSFEWLDHHELSFGTVVRNLAPVLEDPAAVPSHVSFMYVPQELEVRTDGFSFGGMRVLESQTRVCATEADLSFYAAAGAEELAIGCFFNIGCYPRSEVKGLLISLIRILELVGKHGAVRASELETALCD